MSYLPNIITLFRIAMVPVLVLLLKSEDYAYALFVFLLAGVSDALDGYIAKRFGFVSQLGAVMDPLADKLLLVSSYVMLTVLGQIPFWLLLCVAFRDLLIVGGYLVYVSLRSAVQMRPSYLSKINTFMQISLVVAILAQHGIGLDIGSFVLLLTVVVGVTTIASGAHYLWVWVVRREIEGVSEERKSDE